MFLKKLIPIYLGKQHFWGNHKIVQMLKKWALYLKNLKKCSLYILGLRWTIVSNLLHRLPVPTFLPPHSAPDPSHSYPVPSLHISSFLFSFFFSPVTAGSLLYSLLTLPSTCTEVVPEASPLISTLHFQLSFLVSSGPFLPHTFYPYSPPSHSSSPIL